MVVLFTLQGKNVKIPLKNGQVLPSVICCWYCNTAWSNYRSADRMFNVRELCQYWVLLCMLQYV